MFSLVPFLWLAWVCDFFYSHREVQTWCSLLLRVHVATDSFFQRQSQPLDTLNIGKCARWRELKDEDEWSTWKYVSYSRKHWPVPGLVPCFGICPSCLWILSFCIWSMGIYKQAPLTEFFLIVGIYLLKQISGIGRCLFLQMLWSSRCYTRVLGAFPPGIPGVAMGLRKKLPKAVCQWQKWTTSSLVVKRLSWLALLFSRAGLIL